FSESNRICRTAFCFGSDHIDILIQSNILEQEDLVSFLCACALSVDVQGHLFLVGIYLNGHMVIRTKGISSSCNMNKGFIRPVCLINVVGVFLHLSVQGYQALVISSFHAAFISGVAAEVKHVPDMSGPQIWSFVNDLGHMLMVLCLIFFCIVFAFWIICMPADDTLAAIVGNSQRSVRIHLMEFIQPFFILGIVTAIRSEERRVGKEW